jgi:hypothetical protein
LIEFVQAHWYILPELGHESINGSTPAPQGLHDVPDTEERCNDGADRARNAQRPIRRHDLTVTTLIVILAHILCRQWHGKPFAPLDNARHQRAY